VIRVSNLCIPTTCGYTCAGKDTIQERRTCKYFPATSSECPEFNLNGYGECNYLTAQFEAWALLKKPE